MGGVNKKNRAKKMKLKCSKMADLIRADLDNPEKAEQMRNHQPVDVDLPGLGQFYCVQCDRYFISSSARDVHETSKKHKTRVRRLKEEPYTIEESVAASGKGAPERGLVRLSVL